jgi:hypothetical protein
MSCPACTGRGAMASENLGVLTGMLCSCEAAKVYYGLPKTHGVSETGHVGLGTVVHFGTPQHTAYLYRGVAGIHGYISQVISIF